MGSFIGMLILIALLANGLNGTGIRTESGGDQSTLLECQPAATARPASCAERARHCKDLTVAFDEAEATRCPHPGSVGDF
jgi:hypothetical protein